MSMNLFLGRISYLRPSFPLNRITPLASSNAPIQASPPNPHFSVQSLVQSCGLSSDEARKASKYMQRLKSSDNPDAVLQFLREIGVSEADIRTAVSRNPRLLCTGLNKTLRPNIEKLQEVGFSIEDISSAISSKPGVFLSNFVPKIDFWLAILGSVENLSLVLRYGSILNVNMEKVVVPNLTFLQVQCGLSLDQILQLIKFYPSVISCNPEKLKIKEKWVEDLGIACSSGIFVHVLGVVVWLNQRTLDSRLNNLKRLGLSQEEIALAIIKAPSLLRVPEKLIARKMELLIDGAGFDKIYVVQHAFMLLYSLQKRLIPRTVVRNLLRLKGFAVADRSFACILKLTEKQFLAKFIFPFEHAIPGLRQLYADAENFWYDNKFTLY
ncbi:uncharacterized protein LOC144552470 [Carex rostrata]